ncbi:MAG: hypothetical protein JNM82_07860 [Rhodocyclaceae bacterium]|nr:hypothetical protein [Rhodocyclaceae bacterium]
MEGIDDYGWELGVECAWPAGWGPGRTGSRESPARAVAGPAGDAARSLREFLARLAGDGRFAALGLPRPGGPGLMNTG